MEIKLELSELAALLSGLFNYEVNPEDLIVQHDPPAFIIKNVNARALSTATTSSKAQEHPRVDTNALGVQEHNPVLVSAEQEEADSRGILEFAAASRALANQYTGAEPVTRPIVNPFESLDQPPITDQEKYGGE